MRVLISFAFQETRLSKIDIKNDYLKFNLVQNDCLIFSKPERYDFTLQNLIAELRLLSVFVRFSQSLKDIFSDKNSDGLSKKLEKNREKKEKYEEEEEREREGSVAFQNIRQHIEAGSIIIGEG